MLADGFHDVPPGKVATVVTHLEMTAQAAPRPVPEPESITLDRVATPDLDWYRDLFQRVGGQDWLWFSRLNMNDAELSAILNAPEVELYALMAGDHSAGLVELDFRDRDTCELAFFGVTPDLIGAGAGRFMMNHAIARAWSRPIRRFTVHTCTLDSPAALPFYRRSGFVPIRQQVEIADDPRLTGKLPRDSGRHIPIFD
ncbi:GNAT family N-acetyltransferase [Sedimentitalea sp. JM2-8]|uniref:GNAT family N-acetyltransferase n=1 Tax=Sedimentitalea xiamensis TaxID=3050037 RepID=A0ABT7FGX6_9RHOB|nr:GNAT family N-acetyltransferase [Sedimentitalea xiamensis]MDK3074039.1 GNAT family N-acetyltransferase [Sedimentitalea xiamensis]